MATIKDIARAAGVSVSTVSHALSGNRPISEATRARVLEAVAELGYRPNRLAQGLVSKTTRSLGLLVPDLANPFFSVMAESLEVQAQERGYSVILCNTNLDPEREAEYLDVLLSRQVDGLLYFPGTSVPNPALQEALERQTPIVVVDERLPTVPGVFVDNVDGGRQIGELLAHLGHRRILFLGGAASLPTVQDRLRGLESALHTAFDAAGVAFELRMLFGDYRASFGYETIHAYAREGRLTGVADAPTAIVAGNDLIALGALRALREIGIEVPSECSLVGFDGLEFCMLTTPSLTTVQQPTSLIARSAIDLLIDRIEATSGALDSDHSTPALAPQIVLPVSLVVRESVAAAPGQ